MAWIIVFCAGGLLSIGYWWLSKVTLGELAAIQAQKERETKAVASESLPSYSTGRYAVLNVSRALPVYDQNDPFPANEKPAVKMECLNNGNEPATSVYGAGKVFLLHDDTDAKLKRAVDEFQKAWPPVLAKLRSEGPGSTMQPPRPNQPLDEQGPEATGNLPISVQQREWILEGKRIVLVVAAVRYEDSNGEYELQMCRYLQRPIPGLRNWNVCSWHDGLVKIRSKP
jgi:hypothetical protein